MTSLFCIDYYTTTYASPPPSRARLVVPPPHRPGGRIPGGGPPPGIIIPTGGPPTRGAPIAVAGGIPRPAPLAVPVPALAILALFPLPTGGPSTVSDTTSSPLTSTNPSTRRTCRSSSSQPFFGGSFRCSSQSLQHDVDVPIERGERADERASVDEGDAHAVVDEGEHLARARDAHGERRSARAACAARGAARRRAVADGAGIYLGFR